MKHHDVSNILVLNKLAESLSGQCLDQDPSDVVRLPYRRD